MTELQKTIFGTDVRCVRHKWRVAQMRPFKAVCSKCKFVTFIRADVMTRRELEVFRVNGL